MKIGYSKIGRSFNLDVRNASIAGGDIDVVRGLHRLATAHPESEIWILGRNSGEDPRSLGLPANIRQFWTDERRAEFKERTTPRSSPMTAEQVVNVLAVFDSMTQDAFCAMDHHVVWAGQHGTSNSPLPPVGDRSGKETRPQDAFVLYCSLILRGINAWRAVDPLAREEIWLCPDPRNYLKFRDGSWPWRHPIIAQYDQVRKTKHERYGSDVPPVEYGFDAERAWIDPDEPGVWKSKVDYIYAALELTALPTPETIPLDLDAARLEFGVVSNENRANVSRPRAPLVRDWVVNRFPEAPIFGIWSEKGQEALGRKVEPVPYTAMLPTMRAFRATCSFPASGSYWATAKPWEAFAVGTICFFHPDYDKQNHILKNAPEPLPQWLRVTSPEELTARVTHLSNNLADYQALARLQRLHFENCFAETQGGMKAILDRLTPVRTILPV